MSAMILERENDCTVLGLKGERESVFITGMNGVDLFEI